VRLETSGDVHARAQVGLLISRATVWREVCDYERYLEDLDDVLVYAENMDFDDVVSVVREEIKSYQA